MVIVRLKHLSVCIVHPVVPEITVNLNLQDVVILVFCVAYVELAIC